MLVCAKIEMSKGNVLSLIIATSITVRAWIPNRVIVTVQAIGWETLRVKLLKSCSNWVVLDGSAEIALRCDTFGMQVEDACVGTGQASITLDFRFSEYIFTQTPVGRSYMYLSLS